MKITEVKAIRVNRYCFAKITTDEGIYGIGETGAFGALEASAAHIIHLRPTWLERIPCKLSITGRSCSAAGFSGGLL